MTPKKSNPPTRSHRPDALSEGRDLRQQAEEKLSQQKSAATSATDADTLRLLHELQVHQIELEMQNEELVQARAEAEEAYCQYTDLYDFAPVGYFTLARDGAIRKVNLAGANLLGMEREKLVNRRLGVFVSSEYLPAFNAFLEKLLSGHNRETCEVIFLKNDGELFWARLEATCFEGSEESRAIMVDVTEHKHDEELIRQYTSDLEKRVEERTAELVRASHVKDEFLASMSHELRTPLSGILGFSETLLENVHGPLNEKQNRAVELIYSSGMHLLGLISDILDVSKIESGNFDIQPENILIDDVCQASLIFIKQLAQKKSINVEYSCSSSNLKVHADPRRLKQILVNLLNNAVKFTPEHGQVKLEVWQDDKSSQLWFSVTDTGIGITPEDLQKLFKPFVQLDSSLSRQYEGTGLGLSLVKKLVELHGGSVEVESKPGSGSCFHFSIPGDISQITGVESVKPSAHNTFNAPAANPRLGKRRILLVGDDEINMMVTSDYLNTRGYEVVEGDGFNAIQQALQQKPDLILMDIQMPGMDGLETIKRLRAMTEFASIPIIVLTALAMPGDRERCLEAGANEYLTKPVSLKTLAELIESLLQT